MEKSKGRVSRDILLPILIALNEWRAGDGDDTTA